MKPNKMPKIEHGIPIPMQKTAYHGWVDYLRSLKVGDSFVHSGMPYPSNMHIYAKRAGVKIVTRSIGAGKYRIWCVHKNAED